MMKLFKPTSSIKLYPPQQILLTLAHFNSTQYASRDPILSRVEGTQYQSSDSEFSMILF
jgi:hypothetical protein